MIYAIAVTTVLATTVKENDSNMAVPIFWRNKKQRYSLQGDVCPECNQAIFPPREVCPYCHGHHYAAPAQTAESPVQQFVFVLPEAYSLSEAGDD